MFDFFYRVETVVTTAKNLVETVYSNLCANEINMILLDGFQMYT